MAVSEVIVAEPDSLRWLRPGKVVSYVLNFFIANLQFRCLDSSKPPPVADSL